MVLCARVGAVADNQTGQIDRQKSGCMNGLRKAENHDRRRRHKGRVQPLRQFDAD